MVKYLALVLVLMLSSFASDIFARGCFQQTILYRTGYSCGQMHSDYTIGQIILKTGASAKLRLMPADSFEDLDIQEIGKHVGRYYLQKRLAGEQVTIKDIVKESGLLGERDLGFKLHYLKIDDEEVEANARNIIRAVIQVAEYIADIKHDGSVAYSYSFTYDGMRVCRSSHIVDGAIYLHSKVVGGLPNPVSRVVAEIWANEHNGGTNIQTKLTVTVKDKPRVFNGLANSIVAKEVGKARCRAQCKARAFVNSSEKGDRYARLANTLIDEAKKIPAVRILGR